MKRILFVENVKRRREVIVEFLTDKGYEVDVVADAYAAFESLSQKKYEVVIIDTSENISIRNRQTLCEVMEQDFPQIVRIGYTGQIEIRQHPNAKLYDAIVLKYMDKIDWLLEYIEEIKK